MGFLLEFLSNVVTASFKPILGTQMLFFLSCLSGAWYFYQSTKILEEKEKSRYCDLTCRRH